MGLFSFFKKKESPKNNTFEAEKPQGKDTFTIDKIDYYYDEALEAYCKANSVSEDSLTDAQRHDVNLYAGNHIGFFVAWLIKNDLLSDEHKTNPNYEKVKSEIMTGTEYLILNCDTKLWSQDVKEPVDTFVKMYYERNYYQDYCNWVVSELHDLPMQVICSWENYHSFEHILDDAYAKFCENFGY